MTSAYVGRF